MCSEFGLFHSLGHERSYEASDDLPDCGHYFPRLPERMTHDEYVQGVRSKIVSVARSLLAGELSWTEGSRTISRLRPEAEVGERDKDFDVFVGIDSETDAFPMGAVRDLWDKSALEKLQPEIERMEAWAKTFGTPACHAIIVRWAS